MNPRIRVITLGVGDLEKSLAFYRDGLGLPTQGIIGTEFEDGAVKSKQEVDAVMKQAEHGGAKITDRLESAERQARVGCGVERCGFAALQPAHPGCSDNSAVVGA